MIMRKEVLLRKKEELVKKMPWDIREAFEEEDIKAFSLSQLETIIKISQIAEEERMKHQTFHSLSVNEVVHCGTGKIIYVDDNGEISEESEEEVMKGAACNIYKKYKKRSQKEKA